MPTAEECHTAIGRLASRLAGDGRASGLDRSVSAHITDLGLVFRARLHDGVLDEITTEPGPPGQIRMELSGDDLLALADGTLSLAHGWRTGRVKLHASLPDLLRLRSLV